MSGCGIFPREVLEIPQSALESRLEKDALVAVRHPARPGAGGGRELGPFQAQSLLLASSWEWAFYSSSFITVLGCERPVSFIFGPSSEILHITEKLMNLRAARPPRRRFLEHEGEKSSLVEDPQGKRRCHFPNSRGTDPSRSCQRVDPSCV